ncbi:MAG: hypothetical protein L0Y71_04230, partial [Gemmataceae bacterium]|nr:hypothetical protein [Gemmataceae bacterium]
HNTRLEVARMEGLQKGQLIGAIRLSEQLLGRPQTAAEQLASLSSEELTRLAEALQEEVFKRA